ncbi:glycosyltransferase family 9 protein [bacterium]|nr:glycosyltransferase family 9 protein [bacterium]
MTTPAIRKLAETRPNIEIDFLTYPPSNQIFEYNPYVKNVYAVPSKASFFDWLKIIKKLRKRDYALTIDFQGSPRTALMGFLSGASQRIGFNFRGRSLFYTDPITIRPGITYSPLHKLELLSPLGIESKDGKIDFFTGEQDRNKARKIVSDLGYDPKRPLVSVSPVSRRVYKVWPAENFASVCDFLIKRHKAQILFLWGPGEYHFIQNVKDKMREHSMEDYDIPTIRESVALQALVDLHIGNDNGPMHFAISTGTPTIAVFGKPLAENWTPPNTANHIGLEFDPGCKRKCFYPKCDLECLSLLTVESVIEAAEIQINRIFN